MTKDPMASDGPGIELTVTLRLVSSISASNWLFWFLRISFWSFKSFTTFSRLVCLVRMALFSSEISLMAFSAESIFVPILLTFCAMSRQFGHDQTQWLSFPVNPTHFSWNHMVQWQQRIMSPLDFLLLSLHWFRHTAVPAFVLFCRFSLTFVFARLSLRVGVGWDGVWGCFRQVVSRGVFSDTRETASGTSELTSLWDWIEGLVTPNSSESLLSASRGVFSISDSPIWLLARQGERLGLINSLISSCEKWWSELPI